MLSDYLDYLCHRHAIKAAHEESYHDVSAWCPRHLVGRKTVAELAKDKLNPDVSALIFAAAGHLLEFHFTDPESLLVDKRAIWAARREEGHLLPNLTPSSRDGVSTCMHWKKINVDEDYEYSLETYLDANRRSVNSARLINFENWERIEDEYDPEYDSEEESSREPEEEFPKRSHKPEEEFLKHWLRTPYSRYVRDNGTYYPHSHSPAADESELLCRFELGHPDPLPHFQIHPILGFPYL